MRSVSEGQFAGEWPASGIGNRRRSIRSRLSGIPVNCKSGGADIFIALALCQT